MRIIIKSFIAEKQIAITDKIPNRFCFSISPNANKAEVKKYIEEMYGVRVIRINTINYIGKYKSRYTKSGIINGRKRTLKKVIITLQEAERIDFFTNV